jgi:MFS family permease
MGHRRLPLREIFRQRNFVLLWSGQIISRLGDWLTAIALPFYVYQMTHSALATGSMFMVQTLPPILLGSIAGVWVDRWNHRQTMIVADVARAAFAILFVWVALTGRLWIAYLAVLIQSTLSLFFDPARNAILPYLVRNEELSEANNLNSIGSDGASLVGPLLGGLIALKIGLGGAAVLDSLTFMISAVLVYKIIIGHSNAIPKKPQDASKQRQILFFQEWIEGFLLLKDNAILFRLFTMIIIAMLGQGIINVLWIIFVNQVLKGSSLDYGIVQVAVAMGGIMGAFVNAKRSKQANLPLLVGISGMMVGLALLLTFFLPILSIILVLQVICGYAAVGFFVTQQTIMQISTPKDYLGRIFGTYQMINAIAFLLGEGIGSVLGGLFGTVAMLTIAALLYILAGLFALLTLQNPAKITVR